MANWKSSVLRERAILLVDDSRFMLHLLVQILRSFAADQLLTATSVEEAREILRGTVIDCLVVDWMMEPTDGLVRVREIRRGPDSPRRDLPIVLCTAYAEKGRVLEARKQGVNEVLAKPVSSAQVYAKLAAALSDQREFIVRGGYVGPRWRLGAMPPDDVGAGDDAPLSQHEIDRLVHPPKGSGDA